MKFSLILKINTRKSIIFTKFNGLWPKILRMHYNYLKNYSLVKAKLKENNRIFSMKFSYNNGIA